MNHKLPETYYWQIAYQSAVLETDTNMLAEKMVHAEDVLRIRVLELAKDLESHEYRELMRTMQALRVLRTERLPPKVSERRVPRMPTENRS